jgi:phosphatidylglycerol---prolipoprotein diacylglyceryl transferase
MALLESATQETLAVTYWFDPVAHVEPYPVTVRFSGRRVDVKGRLQSGDRFVQDETIENVVPGSGPISLTARVRGINPGKWTVTAYMLGSVHPARGSRDQENAVSAARPLSPIVRLWRRWAPPTESVEPVRTCLTPLAHVPGILPGIWGAMVTLGINVALMLQFLVISVDHLALGLWWALTLVAIAVGIVGAKVWYIVLYRREHRINGWCIQGFITGATLAAAILLVALGVPAGAFLDVTAPGLLVAMAVGRVGCFFAGCCGGECGPPINAWARAVSPPSCWSRCSRGYWGWEYWWRSWVTGRRAVPSSLRGWRPTPWGDKVFCVCVPSSARRGWVH